MCALKWDMGVMYIIPITMGQSCRAQSAIQTAIMHGIKERLRRMPAGHKNYTLRGGVDDNDFPPVEISLKDVRAVSRVVWGKWGHLVADNSPRDLLALAYAEGLYHGLMIATKNPEIMKP